MILRLASMFNKYFVLATYLMDPISCDLFSKVFFKYLEAKYRTYRTVFIKYFIQGSCLMDQISCDFFWEVRSKNKIKSIIHGSFLKLIVFQTSFKVFEMV